MPQRPSRLWRSSLLLPLAAALAAFAPPAFAGETPPASGAVVDRDEFSTTTKSGEAFKTRTYPAPVNFQEDDGSWKAIDRTLQLGGDGAVHPVAVDGDAAIPASLGRPVVLEHDGQTLSFRLLGADTDADREVSGTKASFDDALSGVDISYKARANGLKELITLASRSSRRIFSYDVAADANLSAAIIGGDLVFTDAAGTEQFRVAAPLAWDSAELAETANALTLSVEKTADRRWRLTMRADDKWLDDPARVFPITLDPDYYWIDGYMRFHGANQDCAMAGGTMAGQKLCAYTALQVGYGNSRPYKSVMKFDIAAAIPAYATATASRFLAWQFPSSQKFNVSSRLRTVTRDWDNTATFDVAKTGTPWTTKGGDTSADPNLTGSPTTIGPSGYWSYWNAPLPAINGWIKRSLPNYGFQLSTDLTGPTAVKSAYEFTSTDGAQNLWPALEVTWVPDTTAPTGVVPNQGLGTADQDILGGSQTVTINASAQDDASGVAKLELLRDSGTLVATKTISCPGTICPLSAAAPLNLTATGLTEGAHTLALRATDGAGNVTTTSAWNIYVDRTAPAFDPASVARLLHVGTQSWTAWDEAEDPFYPDGTGGFAVASYAYRYTAGGVTSAWATSVNPAARFPGTPSSVSLEVVATDEAGNSSAPRLFTATAEAPEPDDALPLDSGWDMPPAGDTPASADFDPSNDEFGIDDYNPYATSRASALAADGPLPVDDSHSFKCTGRWAPIQALFSGFVTGNCTGGAIVRSQKRFVCSVARCDGYPGVKSEGWSWNKIQFPSTETYSGCGWMNRRNRISPVASGGPAATPCKSLNHDEPDFIRKTASVAGAPGPSSANHPGLMVWSSTVAGKERGAVEYIPRWTREGKTCQAYANVNPFLKARQTVKSAERTYVIPNGTEKLNIRYMVRRKIMTEAGRLEWFVMTKSDFSGDKDRAWGFVNANCLFSKE